MIKPHFIKEIMITDLYTVTPDTEILSATTELLRRNISGAPVLDGDGNLLAVLSKRDCLKAALNAHYHHVWGGLVSDYMVSPVETIAPDTELTDAALHFINSRFRRIPVVENHKLLGQVSRSDVLRALFDTVAG